MEWITSRKTEYVHQVWQKEWDETGLVSNKFHEILPKLSDKLLSFCNTRKENTVLNRLHIGHSYLTHSFILRKEEAPVCVACNVVLTVKHILIECADLLEIRKIFWREIFVFTLSERDSGSGFWFLAWDWCVLQNMKCVKVMFARNVFTELFKIFMWNVLKFVSWITRRWT